MYNWELIDYNPDNGLKKYVGDNPDDPEGVCIRYEQDGAAIDNILNHNRFLANHVNTGKMNDTANHVASIPVGVMYEWLVKHGVDCWNPHHADKVRQLLNDPDYRYLKVRNIII